MRAPTLIIDIAIFDPKTSALVCMLCDGLGAFDANKHTVVGVAPAVVRVGAMLDQTVRFRVIQAADREGFRIGGSRGSTAQQNGVGLGPQDPPSQRDLRGEGGAGYDRGRSYADNGHTKQLT
ncbi:hypothetical protein V502_10614 [Pseudogymnoascus sp. VKM F-4520 (FW-2644)]|nr:hypothetical protein V502_10614 [Pseudogymnoascus sp. VKM F-4520 (FW-2644)]